MIDPVDRFFMGGGYYSLTGLGQFTQPHIEWSSDNLTTFNEVDLHMPGQLYVYELIKIGTRKYQLCLMPDYAYWLGAQVLTFDFN